MRPPLFRFSGDIIYRDVRVEECILDDFDLARVSEPLSYTIIKRKAYSVECGVWSVKFKVWSGSVECKVWSAKCGV